MHIKRDINREVEWEGERGWGMKMKSRILIVVNVKSETLMFLVLIWLEEED